MWFVFLFSSLWAATPPPFDTSKLNTLSLCLDNFARVCYTLERVKSGAVEIKENVQRNEKKNISGVEFDNRVKDIIGKVKPPLKAASDCAPRLILNLEYQDRKQSGLICLDQEIQKEGSKWWPYFR